MAKSKKQSSAIEEVALNGNRQIKKKHAFKSHIRNPPKKHAKKAQT